MSQSVSSRRAHPRSFHHQLPPPFSELQMDSPNPDHLLVTASFGRILTATQLDAFLSTRRLNVHPSLLPAYRGPAPIQHTLLNGEQETGVCVINMLKKKEGIDAGGIWGFTGVVCVPLGLSSLKNINPIVVVQPVPKEATFTSLGETLACEGGKLLVSVLRDMRAGKVLTTRTHDSVRKSDFGFHRLHFYLNLLLLPLVTPQRYPWPMPYSTSRLCQQKILFNGIARYLIRFVKYHLVWIYIYQPFNP